MSDKFYTRDQIANLCGVNKRQTYHWTTSGKLPRPDKTEWRVHLWQKTNKMVKNLIESYKNKKSIERASR